MPKRNSYAWGRRFHKTSDVERPKKSRFDTIQNVVTFILSVSAFLLSAVSAYFSVIRVEDELSLISRNPPQIAEDQSNPEQGDREFLGIRINRDSSMNFIFMNSGTRPITITDVKIVIYNFDDFNRGQQDCYYHQENFTTTFTPVVVRAGETVISTFNLKSAPSGYTEKGNEFVHLFEAHEWLREHSGEKWTSLSRVTCAIIEGVGYQSQWEKTVPIDWAVSGMGAIEKMASGGNYDKEISVFKSFLRPELLYKNERTIFW